MSNKRKSQRRAPIEQSIWAIDSLLRSARQAILNALEPSLIQSDLSYSQWIVLNLLSSGASHNSTQIARLLIYDSGAFTRLIDTLEKRGLVTRERDKQDRRVVWLTLTPDGTTLHRALLPLLTLALERALAAVPESDRVRLARVLKAIVG